MISTTDNKPQKTATPDWSTRMSFLFGLCALLGILLLIFSEVGFAQSLKLAQAGGFRPGGGPAIGNPLNDPYNNDDDFEDFDDQGDAPIANPRGGPPRRGATAPQPMYPVGGATGGSGGGGGGTGGISVGGNAPDNEGSEIRRTRKGIDLNGGGADHGIRSKNELASLNVDTESGEGLPANKELITDFNFPDADIMDIAKTLGRLTGKNFILDKEVKGRVSIISNSPITVGDAWRAFLTSLDMNSLAIVPTGKYLRIMRQNDAKGKNVRLYSASSAPNTDALVTKIFKIKYISAKELENVIRTYANMGARIYGFEQTNTLIITDTGSNIDKIAKMIAFLDVEGFDAGIEVVQVKYASAVELQKLIDTLLPGTQTNSARPGFGGGIGGNTRGNFTARRTKEGGLVNTIIADERTNTLIVHANPKGAEQVRELVARLDRKMPAAAGGGKVHVVYLQFADSEEMAKTLGNFSQNSKPAGGGGFGMPGAMGGIGINPNEGSLFEGQIKIAADKTTNSLVITASPADYSTLLHVVNKLDVPRDQIFVEILIMEIAMQRTSDYAANVLNPRSGVSLAPTSDLINLIKDPTAIPGGLVLQYRDTNTTNVTPINPTGTGTTTSFPIPNLAALIKAIQTSSKSNIVATPQLMTMDNEEATFESSDKIPQLQSSTAATGVTSNGVTYLDVPLTVKIKPQLNRISNFIKMNINATISDVNNTSVPKGVQDIGTQTTKRAAQTAVMVADGDTVVLGGLVRDKSNEVVNKVPLLGDIPVLGWLFKSKSAIMTKSNLMLFITPRIVRQPEAVRAVLDKKLKERDEFIEREFDGKDPSREARNTMIRGLPDVNTIKNYNSRKVFNLDDGDQTKENANEAAMNELHENGTLPGDTQMDRPNAGRRNGRENSREGKDTLTLPQLDPVPAPAAKPNVSSNTGNNSNGNSNAPGAIPPSIVTPSTTSPTMNPDPFALPAEGTHQ